MKKILVALVAVTALAALSAAPAQAYPTNDHNRSHGWCSAEQNGRPHTDNPSGVGVNCP